MPSFVLSDAFVTINAVDLSDQVESVEITQTRALKEATTMGKAGVVRKAGLHDWTMRVNFRQNFDAGKVDATLAAIGIGVQTAVRVRASKTDAISATNPEYQGNGMFGEYPILGGETVGEISNASVTFVGSDGVALIRDTAP
jgi:hypothetical protein